MGRKTNPDEVGKALKLRLEGFTVEDIAEELGRSREWVFKHTKHIKLEIKCKTRNMTKSKVTVENNRLINEQGKKLRQITCIPIAFGGMNTNKM